MNQRLGIGQCRGSSVRSPLIKKTYLFSLATGLLGCSAATAALSVGTVVNYDFATANNPASGNVTNPGVIGSASQIWNTTNGGFNGAGGQVDSAGNAVNVGSFVAGGSTGASGSGFFGWGGATGNAVGQDYLFLTNDNIANGNVLNGLTVGSFRRFTVFTNGGLDDGLNVNQVWNLHFLGAGNADNQGLNIMVGQGAGATATFLTGSSTGAGASTYDPTFDGNNNSFSINGLTPTVINGGAEFELFIFTPETATTSALNGVQLELVSVVPEPSSALLGLLGLGAFAARRSR